MLKISDLHKSYGTTNILRGAALELGTGRSIALRGESGSGKSTLLHLIATLDRPDRGHIWLDGIDTTTLDERAFSALRREKIGIVFQQFNLIPALNVAQNLAFQARLAGRYDPGWSDQIAQRLGLDAHLTAFPETLSGGQQQRVAIGRALAVKPRLLLADEPTGNLDPDTGTAVLDLMLQLVADSGAALFLVTHSRRIADRLERTVTLSNGIIA